MSGHLATPHLLPPELWSSIFLATLPKPPSFPIPSQFLPRTVKITDAPLVPIVISSVCRLWRNIACCSPQLWENCWLSYRNPELNDLWISRAGTQGLHLIGICPERTYYEWTEEFGCVAHIEATRKFSQSILRHLPRWKSARIDVGPLAPILLSKEWLDMLGLPELYCHASLLEVFQQESHFNDHRLMPSWTVPLLSKALSLKELSLFLLTGVDLGHLQLPQLVDLEIHFISLEDALGLLQSLSQLQKFRVGANYRSHPSIPAPHIIHQNLEHLEVREESSETTLLNYITVPSLRVFHATNERQFSFFALIEMLKRSGCRLEELVFTGVEITSGILRLILEQKAVQPSLKVLEVNYPILGSALLRFLQYDPKRPFLPSLERIIIMRFVENYTELKSCDGYLADLLASRCFVPKYREGEIADERVCLRHFSLKTLPFSGYQLDIARIAPLPPIKGPHFSKAVCTVEFGLDYGTNKSGKDKVVFFLPTNQPECEESEL